MARPGTSLFFSTNPGRKTGRNAINAFLCLAACLSLLGVFLFAQGAANVASADDDVAVGVAADGNGADAVDGNADDVAAEEAADNVAAGTEADGAVAEADNAPLGALSLAPVAYLDENGIGQTCRDYVLASEAGASWGTAGKETWVVALDTITIEERILTEGDVRLILVNGCALNANKGIHVPKGSSLTIYAQSVDKPGALTAAGYYDDHNVRGNAGIGGDSDAITINGGSIKATAYYGAAIGGSQYGSIGAITINGGTVWCQAY